MTIESTLTDWDAGARQCVIEADQLFPGFSWGTYNGHDPSKGLAADAMVPAWQTAAGRAKGQELADWIWVNRARWGIWYVIFDGRIISQTRPEQGWIRYYDADSTNPSRSHKNHVHVSWRSAPSIPVVWVDRLVPGVADSDSVRVVQRALGVPSDGAYGPSTITAAAAFQRSLGDAPEHCDGVLGPRQTVALLLRSGVRATVRTDPSGSPAPTPKPNPAPPKDPDPMPKPTVTVVSANVLRRTDPDKTRRRWIDRLPDIVAHIRSGGPTVVLLQEVDTVTASDVFEGLGPSWHYDRCHGLAIGWFSPELERVGDPQCVLYPDRENRYRHSIPLRHRATGQQFWADCTHLENDGDPATDGHRARHTEISAFAAGTKTGKRVFGGDLNSTTPSTTSATERQRQKPRPILRGAGWWLLTDQTDVTDRALESHHGGKTRNGGKGPWIDDAGGKGVTYVPGSGRLIRTDQTDASDHHMLRFAVRL